MTTTQSTVQEQARVLAQYVKRFHAGGFASPAAKELATMHVEEWANDAGRTVAAAVHLTRDSTRRDYTGRTYRLPAGSLVVTHLGREPGGPIPDLSEYAYVYAYAEDYDLTEGLRAQGRERAAVRVTPASEIIACWGPAGTGHRYHPADQATATEVRLPLAPPLVDIRDEVLALDGWDDDFPYYSDGSWSALSLRGFQPDPAWGIKPAEMPKKWQADHPEAAAYTCDWTTLERRLPATVAWIRQVPLWPNLERVRLLRMTTGHLARHADTDKDAGVNDGQVARVHLPIITHPDITMTTWDLDGVASERHLAAGHLYYLDTRKPHAVANPSPTTRVHLVLDVVVGPLMRGFLATSRPIAA
jgi:hypothetical protein